MAPEAAGAWQHEASKLVERAAFYEVADTYCI
jgi:hypothetical protein